MNQNAEKHYVATAATTRPKRGQGPDQVLGFNIKTAETKCSECQG
jgi:hypothetical protein